MEKAIKIIMADEEKEIIDKFTKELPKEKFDIVAVATDGVQLFELIKQYKPDVVVMDLVLPQFDGFDVMEKLNSENINTNIIIFLSKRNMHKW